MGMTNNQLRLIQHLAQNEFSKAKEYAICCCKEDTTQKNRYMVSKYENMLTSSGGNMIELPGNLKGLASFEDLNNVFKENRYYVSEREKGIFETIKKMNDIGMALMEKHIQYLNATLLYGESGVGKTMFGRYVAYKMELPFLYINLSNIVDSYLGGTAKNLSKIFEFANKQKCVLMIDEIDCIASNRSQADGSSSKEMSRTTTCLIQILDSMTNDNIVIGATNLLSDIDPAIKRRFTTICEIKKLSSNEKFAMVIGFLTDAGFQYDCRNVNKYCENDLSQAKIMTHVTKCIADCLINETDKVIL